jgi:hypothetical protein
VTCSQASVGDARVIDRGIDDNSARIHRPTGHTISRSDSVVPSTSAQTLRVLISCGLANRVGDPNGMILPLAGSAASMRVKNAADRGMAVKPSGFECPADSPKNGDPNGIRTRSVYREESGKSGLQDRCRTNMLWIVPPWHPKHPKRREVL